MGYGVDARLVMDPERPTGTCVVMITHKGDHTMLSDPGANAALSPDDLPKDLFTPGCHLHVSGYTLLNTGPRQATLAAIAMARRAGMTISVDGASSAPLERVGAEPFLQMTNGATLLFVNAEQGRVLTGRAEPEQAARVLNAWYPHVVMKLGADGALFYANGRPDPIRVPAPPVERIVDRTGAGDAFCAGFLPSWLDKKPPGEALTSGCRLAAKAMGLVGARPLLYACPWRDVVRAILGHDRLPAPAVLPRWPGRRRHRRQLGHRQGDGAGARQRGRERGARRPPRRLLDEAVRRAAVRRLRGRPGQRRPG